MKNPLLYAALCLLLYGLHVVGQSGGSLTPPPGPPGPTMKTLDEVEPRIAISNAFVGPLQEGSYYLVENLTGGLVINEDNVSIDLAGFTIDGGGQPCIDGQGSNRLSVRNGVLRGNGEAVRLDISEQCELRDLRIEEGSIMVTSGDGLHVSDCILKEAFGPAGILLDRTIGALFERVTILRSQGRGIWVSLDSPGNQFNECVVIEASNESVLLEGNSTGNRFQGLRIQEGGDVIDAAGSSTFSGLDLFRVHIELGARSVLRGATIRGSFNEAVRMRGEGITVEGCTLSNVGTAIMVGLGADASFGVIRDCNIEAIGMGIAISAGSSDLRISGCTIEAQQSGIDVDVGADDAAISGCTIEASDIGARLAGDRITLANSDVSGTNQAAVEMRGKRIRLATCNLSGLGPGIIVGSGSDASLGSIFDCVIEVQGPGIEFLGASHDVRISGCTIDSQDSGVRFDGDRITVEDSNVVGRGPNAAVEAVAVGRGNTIRNCVIEALGGGAEGIRLTQPFGARVEDCSILSQDLGIIVSGGNGGNRVSGNVVSLETSGTGIAMFASSSQVSGNRIRMPSGIGIDVAGSDCQVEKNEISGSGTGIRADTNGGLFIRNSCFGFAPGTHFQISLGNTIGPTISTAGVLGAGDAHPWANFAQ